MNYILQIIGSIIVGGLVILLILQINLGILSTSSSNSTEARTQKSLIDLAETIDNDFNLMGYGYIGTGTIVKNIISDTLGIEFIADMNNDGVLETVKYYTDLSLNTDTANPNDIKLIREVGSDKMEIGVGVTKFRVWCYNDEGKFTTVPWAVKKIVYEIAVESPDQYYDRLRDSLKYTSAGLRRTLSPSNL